MSPPAAVPRDRLPARTLCGKSAERASGIATATRGRLRRLFCVEHVWLVYATSNVIEEQLLEYLVRRGRLDPAAVAEASSRARAAGVRPLDVLRDGFPGDGALREGQASLVEELFASTMAWPDGAVTFAA